MSIILWMEMQGSGERVRWGMGGLGLISSCGSLVVSSDFLSPMPSSASTHDGGALDLERQRMGFDGVPRGCDET